MLINVNEWMNEWINESMNINNKNINHKIVIKVESISLTYHTVVVTPSDSLVVLTTYLAHRIWIQLIWKT